MNEIKTQFAFFWVGEDTSIPTYLVKSIRHIYKDDAFIYQVTDLSTPHIDGVNKTLRKTLPKQMMLARLKAYGLINSNNPICFLDADSLIIDKIKLPEFNKFKAFLIERDDRLSVMNSQLSVAFPEF
jgi:alpha-N-acetylglucosamine transferase